MVIVGLANDKKKQNKTKQNSTWPAYFGIKIRG